MTTPLPANTNPQGGGKLLDRMVKWSWRSLYFVYVLASLVLGVFLLCLPWVRLWENNYVLYLYPKLRPLVSNAFFKGFVLGLGLADILIGISELAQLGHEWKEKHLSR